MSYLDPKPHVPKTKTEAKLRALIKALPPESDSYADALARLEREMKRQREVTRNRYRRSPAGIRATKQWYDDLNGIGKG